MPSPHTPQARLTTVACFPRHYFLENLVMRSDHSLLVTVMNHKELWYVPPVHATVPVEPLFLHTFAEHATGIIEAEPDLFYISTSNLYTTHESHLHRLDLSDWSPGQPVQPEVVLEFPGPVRGLNGSCLIAPNILLLADCFASLIWRVDLPSGRGEPTARVWLKHPTMADDPGGPMPDCPGVNGIQYAAKTNYLYYTSTMQRLFMRVPVDPVKHAPIGEPEFVAGGRMADDFCIDEDAGVAYLATHRQNTIDRVSLEPTENGEVRHSVVGEPFTEQLIGPTVGVWGRAPGEYGRIAYFMTDGGTKTPLPDRVVRPATILRVEFAPSAGRIPGSGVAPTC